MRFCLVSSGVFSADWCGSGAAWRSLACPPQKGWRARDEEGILGYGKCSGMRKGQGGMGRAVYGLTGWSAGKASPSRASASRSQGRAFSKRKACLASGCFSLSTGLKNMAAGLAKSRRSP